MLELESHSFNRAPILKTSLFFFHQGEGTIYLLVYVDDTIVVGSSDSVVSKLLHQLRDDFVLKDLGALHYFLGIEVTSTSDDLLLTQSKYAVDLVRRAGLLHYKSVPTPMVVFEKRSSVSVDLLDADAATRYRSIVGRLQYLTLTRPDIAFSTNKVCQYLRSPTSYHLSAVKRIIRYISGTIDYGLWFVCSSSQLISEFSNADWAGCSDDHRSTGGFAIFFLVPI